jgi:hypothetical protein
MIEVCISYSRIQAKELIIAVTHSLGKEPPILNPVHLFWEGTRFQLRASCFAKQALY